jgi:4'-phosphopantetheinyl transferase
LLIHTTRWLEFPEDLHQATCCDHIDVWTIDSGKLNSTTEDEHLLSGAEVERAAKFATQKLRSRYISAKAAIRKILGEYLNVQPEQLIVETHQAGKPYIKSPIYRLFFNLTYVDNVALLAVYPESDIGIDAESKDAEINVQEVSDLMLSEKEKKSMREFPSAEHQKILIEQWVVKESLVKAVGSGFSLCNPHEVVIPLLRNTDEISFQFGGRGSRLVETGVVNNGIIYAISFAYT